MNLFFNPESVVVIGPGPKPTNLGRGIVENLVIHGYPGLIYLLGRSQGAMFGHPILNSFDQIPDGLDAAIILTPAVTVPGLVDQCGQKGIKRIIIESGGFSEFDSGRGDLEKELVKTAEKHGIRFIGPNCIGTANNINGFFNSFDVMETGIKKSAVGMIAQSGGVGLTCIREFTDEGLGLGKFATIGNKLNVNECDLLEYFIADPDTEVIAMYLESIADGRRLYELARGTDKPIILHKSNTSPASNQIAQSHTASLAADDNVVTAACHQAGIIRTKRLGQLVGAVKTAMQPKLKGRRLAVVSRSGGHAVVAADACAAAGFEMPPLPQKFLAEIQKRLKGGVIRLHNPIDLGDLFDFDFYSAIGRYLLELDEIDGLLFFHGYNEHIAKDSRRFIADLAQASAEANKPTALCLLAPREEVFEVKGESDLPVFAFPEEAAEALKAAWILGQKKVSDRDPVEEVPNFDPAGVTGVLKRGRPGLTESLEAIEAAGFNTPAWRLAGNDREAVAAAEELGYPVAVKTANKAVSHKTDAGGVALDLTGPGALGRALDRMEEEVKAAGYETAYPVVVQAMAPKGTEIILGGKRDPLFGPVVLVGLGGIMVELAADVVLALAPISREQAGMMLDHLKGVALLDGFRGRTAADKTALAEGLVRLSKLMVECPEVAEIDLNPVIALEPGKGITAVDARIALK